MPLTQDRPMASAALASAIQTAKRGAKAPERFQRVGRLDRRALPRVQAGDCRVFKRPTGITKSRIRVSILVDASSSMNHGAMNHGAPTPRYLIATQVARDLAGAIDRLPWVTGDMVAFTTGSVDGFDKTPGGIATTLYPLWKSGQPRANVDRYAAIRRNGTDEGNALSFVVDDLIAERDATTAYLIIIVSDGDASRPTHVRAVVQSAAREGIPVVSVAVAPLNHEAQVKMYGHGNVIDYDPNVKVMARYMARAIGRVL